MGLIRIRWGEKVSEILWSLLKCFSFSVAPPPPPLCPGVAAIMDTEDSKETTDPLRPHIPSFTYAGAGGETPNSSSESDSSASEGEGVLFVPPPQRRKDSASDYSPTGSKSPSSESASEGHSSDSNCSEPARPRPNVTKHVQFMEDSDSSSSNSTVASRSQQPSYPPHSSDFGYGSYYPPQRKAAKNVTSYVEYLESEDSNSDSWPAKRHRHRREESDSEFEMKSESPSVESFMDESSEEEYLPEGRKSQVRRARRKVSYFQCCLLCFAIYLWTLLALLSLCWFLLQVWDEEEDSDSDYMPGGRRRKRTARRPARRRV